jgi:hypothetical protein
MAELLKSSTEGTNGIVDERTWLNLALAGAVEVRRKVRTHNVIVHLHHSNFLA